MLDVTLLRHQDRDDLCEALRRCRSSCAFDMAAAWDTRLRRFYAERYDARRNLVRNHHVMQ
jgi:dynein assembly factor 3